MNSLCNPCCSSRKGYGSGSEGGFDMGQQRQASLQSWSEQQEEQGGTYGNERPRPAGRGGGGGPRSSGRSGSEGGSDSEVYTDHVRIA